jgi:cytidyltransferase-like protein
MDALTVSNLPAGAACWKKLGLFLGSFDPLHLGHEWAAGQLLEHCGRVLLVVPGRHFHKSIRPGENASLAQRLAMLERFARRAGGPVLDGVAGEVLFVRLAARVSDLFPRAEITFGMGDETFARLLRSPEYFARAGLAWTDADARSLAALERRALVFGRREAGPGRVAVPEDLREVSSTRVRAAVAALRGDSRLAAARLQELRTLVAPDILEWVLRSGLYVPAETQAAELRHARSE